MEATRYTAEQAKSLFSRHFEILDQIQDLVDSLNEIGPEVDSAREQGYQPEWEVQEGIAPREDYPTGGFWHLQYVS